ncbi:phosphatase PAP2 family protein [Hymenobacter sp. BT188]|uniref:phosphatase PAP2 family protein n=1 Tax=Hymenobacter sp. BT188 TaxID=2763504 RepID=UPI001651253E|nr:phosphatase PAP2 family protein [Hymenobacter sp. BT188]MBC6607275.1 phosphatase PAP2 family protein [Hymenobacter sp. BT188]
MSRSFTSMKGISQYWQLMVRSTFVAIPLLLLLIFLVDEPLARVVRSYGDSLKPFFELVMRGSEWLHERFFYHGLPIGWLVLLLASLITRLMQYPTSTVWLVALLTLIGSEGLMNILKVYFNRPRPFEVLSPVGPDAGFWQSAGQFDAFPSGHTAWIAGLLMPLALRFPKLRVAALSIIALVAVGRVGLEVHWLSDVVASIHLSLLLTCGFELGTWWLRARTVYSVSSVPDAT